MIFANTWVLIFLAIVPFLVIFYITKGKQASLNISLVDSQQSFSNLFDQIGFHLPFILRILAIIAVIIMLARPQLGKSFTVSKHNGLDIVLAVDTSQSMSGLDLELNGKTVDRLTVLKNILEGFVKQRSEDRLGLLVFGEQAYTQCPLTLDHGAIIDMIKHLEIGMVGNSTAIGSAIAVAVKRLKDLQAKSRVLILMTDGQNTAGEVSPQIAAELAKELGIKIYTVGIGSEGEVPFEVDTPQGRMLVKTEIAIDEELLIEIAESTGGQYFRAKTTEELSKVYQYIDKLEKTEVEVKEYNSFVDIYEYFLWAVFVFFGLEILLANSILFRLT